jgi:hypothetical protein
MPQRTDKSPTSPTPFVGLWRMAAELRDEQASRSRSGAPATSRSRQVDEIRSRWRGVLTLHLDPGVFFDEDRLRLSHLRPS